jgi:hypothetical protein
MKAAETSASIATAACTPLTVVSRSCTTAEIDTFMNDVSITNTNIAAARKTPIIGLPPTVPDTSVAAVSGAESMSALIHSAATAPCRRSVPRRKRTYPQRDSNPRYRRERPAS